MSKYIREGGRCFHESKGRYANPYRPGSAEFNDFERGYFQALKRSPERRRRNARATEQKRLRRSIVLPAHIRVANNNALPDDVYVMLARRAREGLLNDPSYQPPKYGWRAKVYYARIEANGKPLWKIGVTSNSLESRYCRADRRIIVEIRSWQYETREEAEAIERAILAEFADDLYDGASVLRSGGDSELFTRDVLNLDSQDDYPAMVRKECLRRRKG